MRTEMNDEENRLFDVTERYEERFGSDQLLPLEQVAPEVEEPEFLIVLYEKCLAEGKPASEYVEIDDDPDVEY